ncbi:NtaA/DmoA family FMN-dependent monooxygenase [Streptomyces fulvoviolaceus]|uniref:NtaA/DmoA family FMN-dependent monooxygenase n=1 Tax=Streptomyces fulvoviolaceus TaxID=285535 RepID=UPI0004C73CF8|nr:NtaA/DmoA family FMN-dependent monooxygenase [Streptomyces fulvoviolaceus]
MTTDPARRLGLGALVHGSGGQLDFAFHADLARTLERGRFDALFVADADADAVTAQEHEHSSTEHFSTEYSRTEPSRTERFEPLTLLAALSLVTERIGLAATAATTYNHPFHIARKFASLDHISGGRAGWNIVISEHELLHRQSDEFVQVVKALWDSFDDDAVVRDKESGRYYDPAGLHTPHHRGEHFTVRGPLNISRPPQGHPVIFQAGSSETGREFAVRHGEVVFVEEQELGAAQDFYADIKARAAGQGRDPAHVLVWPRLTPYGSPERIADHIETWFHARAADGFHLAFLELPGSAEEFVDHVVPLLQRRGLLRTEYEGTTLRENLGLPRPAVRARHLQETGR